jgi:hypothetical protein
VYLIRVQRFSTQSLRQGQFFPARARGQARSFALTPFVPLAREAGEGGNLWQGAPPCAPTPLSHRVGEGLGVRGNLRSGEPPFAPTSRCHRRARGKRRAHRRAPLLAHPVGEGLGVRATQNAHTPHAANSSDVPLSGQCTPYPNNSRTGIWRFGSPGAPYRVSRSVSVCACPCESHTVTVRCCGSTTHTTCTPPASHSRAFS